MDGSLADNFVLSLSICYLWTKALLTALCLANGFGEMLSMDKRNVGGFVAHIMSWELADFKSDFLY